jgi:LPXTG-motif cell wall-anchored protein
MKRKRTLVPVLALSAFLVSMSVSSGAIKAAEAGPMVEVRVHWMDPSDNSFTAAIPEDEFEQLKDMSINLVDPEDERDPIELSVADNDEGELVFTTAEAVSSDTEWRLDYSLPEGFSSQAGAAVSEGGVYLGSVGDESFDSEQEDTDEGEEAEEDEVELPTKEDEVESEVESESEAYRPFFVGTEDLTVYIAVGIAESDETAEEETSSEESDTTEESTPEETIPESEPSETETDEAIVPEETEEEPTAPVAVIEATEETPTAEGEDAQVTEKEEMPREADAEPEITSVPTLFGTVLRALSPRQLSPAPAPANEDPQVQPEPAEPSAELNEELSQKGMEAEGESEVEEDDMPKTYVVDRSKKADPATSSPLLSDHNSSGILPRSQVLSLEDPTAANEPEAGEPADGSRMPEDQNRTAEAQETASTVVEEEPAGAAAQVAPHISIPEAIAPIFVKKNLEIAPGKSTSQVLAAEIIDKIPALSGKVMPMVGPGGKVQYPKTGEDDLVSTSVGLVLILLAGCLTYLLIKRRKAPSDA